MIKFINKDHQVIKMIRAEQVQSLHHTQILTDENYVSEHLSIQMTHLEDEIIKDAEFVAIPVQGHEFMHHFFWVKDYMYDNDVLNIQGVQASIEMLSKSPIIDYRPQNTTLRAAVEQALNGTGVTARYEGNFGSNSSNAYFTSVWDALKKYCLTWNAEMQCFVEITDSGVGALFIDFRSKIGVNNGARVVYGHNALEIVKEEERAEIYTALIGRGNAEEVGETEDGDATYGRKINFKDVSWSVSNGDPVNKPLGQYYVEIPAATSQYGINQGGIMKPKVGFVDIDTDDPEEVLSRTYTILQEVSRPKALFRTTSAYLNAEVGDEVRVVRPDKDIDYSTRVFEITWDRLNNTAVSVKLGDRIVESQSSRERRITNSASVRAIEEVNRVIEGSVNYIVSANGLNRNYYGTIDPRDDGHTPFLNDIWYRPDPDSDGDTILYVWNGTIWEEITRTFNNEKVAKIMEEVQEIVNEIDLDFEVTIQDVKRVLDGAGEIDLDHIFARLITDGRFGTMFMQNAKAIGLVYEEDGKTESIIGIIDGTPYIKGANIILNGDTKVDGTFAVTKEMISPEVIVDRLIAHEVIDATDMNVINLNANSISGGNLELANGLKITNNGHAVLSVDSSGRMIFDATGAGVATKQELEDIELTPGPQGPQGVPGQDGEDGAPTYTWVKYADTPTSGMSDSPEGKKYIGLAFNKTTATESSSYAQYTWSLMPQNVEIGGRNLFKNTNQQFDWDIDDPSVSERKLDNGITIASQEALDIINSSDTLIVSFLLKAEGLEFINSNNWLGLELKIDFEDGTYSFINLNNRISSGIDEGIIEGTYDWKRHAREFNIGQFVKDRGKIVSYISSATILMRGSIGRVSIKHIMVSSGNAVIDHTLAPEDTDKRISDVHSDLSDGIEDIHSELSVHWEAIDDKVGINAFTQAMDNMRRDYEQGLIEASQVPQEVQNILSRHEAITSNLGDKVEQWNFIDTHMRAGNEGLYIGEIDGDSALLIGTDRISFMQGQEEIAYISGQQMFINRSINVESMQVGSHIFQKVDNNSTIVAWVGG